jgi:hypothetical protein
VARCRQTLPEAPFFKVHRNCFLLMMEGTKWEQGGMLNVLAGGTVGQRPAASYSVAISTSTLIPRRSPSGNSSRATTTV